jgi:hypothetical protein
MRRTDIAFDRRDTTDHMDLMPVARLRKPVHAEIAAKQP